MQGSTNAPNRSEELKTKTPTPTNHWTAKLQSTTKPKLTMLMSRNSTPLPAIEQAWARHTQLKRALAECSSSRGQQTGALWSEGRDEWDKVRKDKWWFHMKAAPFSFTAENGDANHAPGSLAHWFAYPGHMRSIIGLRHAKHHPSIDQTAPLHPKLNPSLIPEPGSIIPSNSKHSHLAAKVICK